MRQRRPYTSDPPPSTAASSSYSKSDKPGRSSTTEGEDKGLGWFFPLFALGLLRYMSATSNIIHDCDEVFNYWEPLHFLLYKSGFQTWEYRFLLEILPHSRFDNIGNVRFSLYCGSVDGISLSLKSPLL